MILKTLFLVIGPVLIYGKNHHSHKSDRALQEEAESGKNGIYMADGDGNPIYTSLVYDDGMSSLLRFNKKPANFLTFDLYTNHNPSDSYRLFINNTARLKHSKINLRKPIKFVVHGWMSSNKTQNILEIKNRYMKHTESNVIVVDWAPLAGNPNYAVSAVDTKQVGGCIGEMIMFLVRNGAKWGNFHLIGHSLGAHICGFAGAFVNGKIRRITGLDPAWPGFLTAFPGNRLDVTDAKFVDIIHTCAGGLGIPTSIGTVDFFPNGGLPPQPACFGAMKFLKGCSHGRSFLYFIESIGNASAYPAYLCDSWINYKWNRCSTNMVPMGDEVPGSAKGNYFLNTADTPPYHGISNNQHLLL